MSGRPRYYDRQGRPLDDLMDWARLSEDNAYKIVIQTKVNDEVFVSTVWLGLDHNFSGHGPPLIFETMIFGGVLDTETWRYPTEEGALAGHDQALAAVEHAQAEVEATLREIEQHANEGDR